MGQEIEKKFIVNDILFDLDGLEKCNIQQGYLAVTAEATEVRIRKKEKAFYLTVKKGGGGQRLETEIDISEEQFEALWPLTEGGRIVKTRYFMPVGQDRYEIDVFGGDLEGLMLVEVEFVSLNEYQAFIPPAWFGKDVTEDRRYKNQSLAIYGKPASGH